MNISIKTSDQHIFKMPIKNVLKSNTIKALLGFDDINDEKEITDEIPSDNIPLDIKLDILTKINIYLDKNNDPNLDPEWNNEYIESFNDDILFDIILASNYLDIKDLLDLSCKKVADDIKKCKTPQEIRRKYNIKNDFTPEEEEQIRSENQWCEEC